VLNAVLKNCFFDDILVASMNKGADMNFNNNNKNNNNINKTENMNVNNTNNVTQYCKKLLSPLYKILKLKTNFKSVGEVFEKCNAIVNTLTILVEKPINVPIDSEKIKEIENTILTLEEKIDSLMAKYSNFASATTKFFKKEIKNEIYSFLNAPSIKFKIQSFLFQRAQIFFCTLDASSRKNLHYNVPQFQLLVIDEASQASLPSVFIPFLYNPFVCILVGDPNQLPPTIKSSISRKLGYETSLISLLMDKYKNDKKNNDNNEGFKMLTIQYRMHEKICLFPSAKYYENNLKTSDMVLKRENILQFQLEKNNTIISNLSIKSDKNNKDIFDIDIFGHPSCFFDIANSEENKEDKGSCSNKLEALYVVETLFYLLQFFEPSQIGVITFYKKQENLINYLINKALETNNSYSYYNKEKVENVLISTVDSFQGNERGLKFF
jgi:superfamily I DNA and/or RNA helicase